MSRQRKQQETDTMTDDGHIGKYFHYMLNMADDDLNPYEYRLLGHYRRVCGRYNKPCTESIREIAKACRMSVGMVTKTRTSLAKAGWITALRITENGQDVGFKVTVIDRMKENVERYAERAKAESDSVHGVNTPVHTVNGGVHGVKQRINKNMNQQEHSSSKKKNEAPAKRGGKKADKPADPLANQKRDLIHAWKVCTHNLNENVYKNETMRDQAGMMIDAGVTPELLTEFLTELMRDAFWRKNPPKFDAVLQRIGAWMADRAPSQAIDTDAAPEFTPSTIAPDTVVAEGLTAAEYEALTPEERQAQIDKIINGVGRAKDMEGGKRGRHTARAEFSELDKSA